MDEALEAAKLAEEAQKETIGIAEATAALENTVPEDGEAEGPEEDNEATEYEEEEEEEAMEVEDPNGGEGGTSEEKGPSEPTAEETVEKAAVAEPSEDDIMAKHAAEATYSTRGRSGETALDILAESSHREAEISLPREKEPTPTAGPSFLSDSLTEEERRTRTRYLPNVDGMNALRKQEIKGDLALARCMTPSASVASTLARKVRRAREDEMDMDDVVAPSDEDKASELLRHGTRSMEVAGFEYELPSSVFVAPSASALNGDVAKTTPPTAVESVTAFNPPRPPESVGPKKKHRMLRWERRPADIEVDLTTYRKTVQKTREELKKAMEEKDRIEMIDNHLRRHFLSHLECMDEEFVQLSDETARVQQECVSAADLLTSRTRSRGAGKSSNVMRDVLAVLRARGTELQEKGISSAATNSSTPSVMNKARGVGGIGPKSFQLWDKSLQLQPRKICQGWTVIGDKVSTPYGEGKVVEILPCSKLGSSQNATRRQKAKKNADDADIMDVDQPELQSSDEPKSKDVGSTNDCELLPPRVAVQLSFGVGFFPPSTVEPLENPASFSDARLAQRWRGMMDSAPLFGESLDMEAMAEQSTSTPADCEASDRGMHPDGTAPTEPGESEANKRTRLLPFGSNLIPTKIGRGPFVTEKSMDELDKEYTKVFFGGVSVLGRPDNIGVPPLVREYEERHQNCIVMKAKLRQVKNQVNRQRRIRLLNQRTYTASQERAARVESLVSEMRTDLKSLKRRLDEEVKALGIDDAEAAKIMLSYYNRDVPGENQDSSPFKRSRKNAEMDETEDEDDAYDSHDGQVLTATQEVSV